METQRNSMETTGKLSETKQKNKENKWKVNKKKRN